MNQIQILQEITSEIKNIYKADKTGHDYYHIQRVVNLAKYIAAKEKADVFVVEVAALMHEYADWKFQSDENLAIEKAQDFLEKFQIEKTVISKIIHIIKYSSFKNTLGDDKLSSLEGFIVRDADMLDSIGAIGIARTFYFGGAYGMPMHSPEISVNQNITQEEYMKGSSCIGYFYEKLLKVKSLIKTKSAKQIAQKRHKFLQSFLSNFLVEWDSDNMG